MSRSFLRFFAGAALVASLPAVSAAQGSCSVVDTPNNCSVAINTTVVIPTIAFLNVSATALDFAIDNAGWTAFLGSAAADTIVVEDVLLTVRSNDSWTLELVPGAWSGGGWTVGDISWQLQAGVCGVADVGTALAGTTTINSGAAVDPDQNHLCLGLRYPNDLSDTRLAPGTYTVQLDARLTAP